MPGAILALLLLVLPQQSDEQPQEPDLAVIDARLGGCSADFTVTDAEGAPIYAAVVHVRIRYGFMGIKRMDLEVGTNSDGKARVAGLPDKARPLTYEVSHGSLEAAVIQDLERNCRATFELALE